MTTVSNSSSDRSRTSTGHARIEVIHTPYEPLYANAICERFWGRCGGGDWITCWWSACSRWFASWQDTSCYFNQARPHTCTPHPPYCGAGCAPAQVPGDNATAFGAKGITNFGAESGERVCVPRVERAAPRLPLGCRVCWRWPKKRSDRRG